MSVGSCGTLYSGNIYDSRDIDHRNDSPAEAQKKLLPINTASPLLESEIGRAHV